MKLNHLNLTVTDVPGTQAFLAKHFGLKEMGSMSVSFSRARSGSTKSISG